MEENEPTEVEEQDHIQAVQSVLASLDPGAFCTGFVAIVEWIEEDGTPSLSMVHTPMPPWHMQGMLAHASKYHDMPVMIVDPNDFEYDEDDEDE